MISLANLRRLLAFSDRRQHVCERGLDKALRALVPLERELQAIEQQAHGLNELLVSQRPENQRLSHAQLLALLRRQAVIRRQIGNLALERIRVSGLSKAGVRVLLENSLNRSAKSFAWASKPASRSRAAHAAILAALCCA